MLYLKLFHGRKAPDEQLDDWGSDGPIFGPYSHAHTTYQCHVRFGKSDGGCDELSIVESELVYYDGVYYGDWSVFGELEGQSVQKFESEKAKPPKIKKRQAKIVVTIKGGICQDVKTNIADECWDYTIVDYDNEPDLPDDYNPFSEDEMKTLFL